MQDNMGIDVNVGVVRGIGSKWQDIMIQSFRRHCMA